MIVGLLFSLSLAPAFAATECETALISTSLAKKLLKRSTKAAPKVTEITSAKELLQKALKYISRGMDGNARAIGYSMLNSSLIESETLHHPEGFRQLSDILFATVDQAVENIPYDRYASLFKTKTIPDAKGLSIRDSSIMVSVFMDKTYELTTLAEGMYTLSSIQAACDLHPTDVNWQKLKKHLAKKLATKLQASLPADAQAEFQMDLISGQKDLRMGFVRRMSTEDLRRIQKELQEKIPYGAYLNLLAMTKMSESSEEARFKEIFIPEVAAISKAVKEISNLLSKDLDSDPSLLLGFLIKWPTLVLNLDQTQKSHQALEAALLKMFRSNLELEAVRSVNAKWKNRQVKSMEDLMELLEDIGTKITDDATDDSLAEYRRQVEREFQLELFKAVDANNLDLMQELISTRAYSPEQLADLKHPSDRSRSLLLSSMSQEMTDLIKSPNF